MISTVLTYLEEVHGMDNFEIRQQIDDIKLKLKQNTVTFVLDDSADLIKEWMNLQRICRHTQQDGTSFFEHNLVCPICDLAKDVYR